MFQGKWCITRQEIQGSGSGFAERDFNQGPPSSCLSTLTQGKLAAWRSSHHWYVGTFLAKLQPVYCYNFLSKNSLSDSIVSGLRLRRLLSIALTTHRRESGLGFCALGTSTHRVNSFPSMGVWVPGLAGPGSGCDPSLRLGIGPQI